MKILKLFFVLSLLINSSLLFSMEYKSSSNTDSLNPVTPTGPVVPRDPVGPTDSGPVKPTKGKEVVDSINPGTEVHIGKTDISNNDWASDQKADGKKDLNGSIISSGKILFSLRHIKPDGKGKCKFGQITGVWEKSPCSRIYGSTPIVKNGKGKNVSSKGDIWNKVDKELNSTNNVIGKSLDGQIEVSGGSDSSTSFSPSYLNRGE